MKKAIKIVSMVLAFCMVVSLFFFATPTKADAANKQDLGDGELTITALENDFKDGKYRINYRFSFKKTWSTSYGVKLTNIRLENSSGKVIYTWKEQTILKEGGSVDKHFSCDFSTLPSDTYYFRYTATSDGYPSKAKNYYRKISHSAGSVSYSTAKKVTDTNGTSKLKVTFTCKMLKGYAPKLEIYDSKNKLVKTYTTKNTVTSDNCNFSFSWDYTGYSNGLEVSSGTYTFKFTCNGFSASKKLNITVK